METPREKYLASQRQPAYASFDLLLRMIMAENITHGSQSVCAAFKERACVCTCWCVYLTFPINQLPGQASLWVEPEVHLPEEWLFWEAF